MALGKLSDTFILPERRHSEKTIIVPMSWDFFAQWIFDIQVLSDELGDGWTTYNRSGMPIGVAFRDEPQGSVYMVKRCIRREENELLVQFEYHVTYDLVYGVPKLCFQVCGSDGRYLNYEQCKPYFKIEIQENPLSMITQMEHPCLQIPIFTMHPCKTADLMLASFKFSKNPVISWLSAVGPTVGLHLDNKYSSLT